MFQASGQSPAPVSELSPSVTATCSQGFMRVRERERERDETN